MVRLTVLYNLAPGQDEQEFLRWRLGTHQHENATQPGVLRTDFGMAVHAWPADTTPPYRFMTTAEWPDMGELPRRLLQRRAAGRPGEEPRHAGRRPSSSPRSWPRPSRRRTPPEPRHPQQRCEHTHPCRCHSLCCCRSLRILAPSCALASRSCSSVRRAPCLLGAHADAIAEGRAGVGEVGVTTSLPSAPGCIGPLRGRAVCVLFRDPCPPACAA